MCVLIFTFNSYLNKMSAQSPSEQQTMDIQIAVLILAGIEGWGKELELHGSQLRHILQIKGYENSQPFLMYYGPLPYNKHKTIVTIVLLADKGTLTLSFDGLIGRVKLRANCR